MRLSWRSKHYKHANSPMNVSQISRKHFEAAICEADAAGFGSESVARYMLSLVVSKYLETRTVADVRSELLDAAENCDPDTDYAFMRP